MADQNSSGAMASTRMFVERVRDSSFNINMVVAVCVVLVIIILVSMAVYSTRAYHRSLSGVYMATPEFCTEAGIMNILLELDQHGQGSVVVAGLEGEVLVNEVFNYTLHVGAATNSSKRHTGTIVMNGIDPAAEDLFPETQNIDISSSFDQLVLSKDGVVYGVFMRDPELSQAILLEDQDQDQCEDDSVQDVDVDDDDEL